MQNVTENTRQDIILAFYFSSSPNRRLPWHQRTIFPIQTGNPFHRPAETFSPFFLPQKYLKILDTMPMFGLDAEDLPQGGQSQGGDGFSEEFVSI